MSLQRLILLRHGKAEQKAASGEDFDRGLVERGRIEAAETGRRLAAGGFVPDLALVSSAARAVQTWGGVAPAFPAARVEETRALFHASAGDVLGLAEAAGAACVMVVGHNPGLHALALALAFPGLAHNAASRRLREGLPTAAAAVFSFDTGAPAFEALFVPGGDEA